MGWWRSRKKNGGTVTVDWVCEQLAKHLDPESDLKEIAARYQLPPNDPRAFVALGSLRATGVTVGLNQESILSHVDEKTVAAISINFCGALAWNYGNRHSPGRNPREIMSELVKLTSKVTQAFCANSSSKPPRLLPHWYACKAMIAYIQNDKPPNPEDLMFYSEYLPTGMIGAKVFLDEILAQGIRIAE